MSYDWEQICKRKTDKELYHIYTGYTILNDEAVKYATAELEGRGFDFDNIDKHKKKWELESLIEEDRFESKRFIYGMPSSKQKFFMIIGTVLFTLFFFIHFISKPTEDKLLDQTEDILFVVAGIIISILNIFQYYRKKKKDKIRKEKISELIKNL